MDYTSERKRKADDQMTKVAAHRFKDDVAYDEGDYGDATTVEEGEEAVSESLLKDIIKEAAWNEGYKQSQAADHPLHKALTAKGYSHASSHFQNGVMPDSHNYVHDDYKNKPVVSLLTLKHKDGASHGFTVHSLNKDSKRKIHGETEGQLHKAISKFSKVNEEDQSTHCAVCNDTHPTKDHPQSIHTARALGGENNVVKGIHEDEGVYAPWMTAAQQERARKTKGTAEMWADKDVEQANKRRQEARKKAKEATVWDKLKEVESKDIQKANKLEKCEACGQMHAHDVPCPDKKLLSDKDAVPSDDAAYPGHDPKSPPPYNTGGDWSGKKVDEGRYDYYDHQAEKPISHPLIRKDDDGKHYYYMGSSPGEGAKYHHHDGKQLHVKHGSFGTAIHPQDETEQEHYEKKAGMHHKGFWKGHGMNEGKFDKFKSNQMTIKDTPEDIKRRSKAIVGMPPPKKVIKSKKDKGEKHKKDFRKMDEARDENTRQYGMQHHFALEKAGYKHQHQFDSGNHLYKHSNGSHVVLGGTGGIGNEYHWTHQGPDKRSGAKTTGSSVAQLQKHLNSLKEESVMEAGRDSTAMKVRLDKEKNPHLFCSDKKCLWKTGGGNCPRHGGPAKKKANEQVELLKSIIAEAKTFTV